MAIPQNTLIGKTRKSIGNVEFSSWKGINVMKSKPITVANPRTDKQRMQRSAHKQTVEIARKIPAAIKLGFVQNAIGMSAYNAFMSTCLKGAYDFSNAPAATYKPENLIVAKGTIQETPLNLIALTDNDQTVHLGWASAALATGQSTTDMVNVVFYNPTTKEFFTLLNLAQRDESSWQGEAPFTIPSSGSWFAYTFFSSADGKRVETSRANSVII